MSIDSQRAQTLSALSTVLSAFLVFVIGGGVVLKIWVDQRKAAAAAPLSEPVAVEESKPESVAPQANVPKSAQSLSAKTTLKSTRRSSSASKTVKATKATKSTRPSAEKTPLTGKGQVVVAGDASRVRLIGSNGTFGSGTVPAGSYTIQATFRGGDPRMAGTVQVSDGQRIIIVCKAAGQRCVQR
jgi:cytoskeletal protein RodZ